MASLTLTVTTTPSTNIPAIPIALKVHAEARCIDDLWTGGTSPDARRKLQNRLNQRAFRRRKAAEKAGKIQVFELEPVTTPLVKEPTTVLDPVSKRCEYPTLHLSLPETSTQQSSSPGSSLTRNTSTVGLPIMIASWCRPLSTFAKTHTQRLSSPEDATSDAEDDEIISFEEGYLRNLRPTDFYRLPADDHLLSLMYYNVFRALTTNVQLLGLVPKLMHTDTYPSPFITGAAKTRHIPPHLQPTLLQRTMPHHPCFDIFPDPVVRDHAIMNTHLLNHGKLCMTLAGRNTWFENERSRRNGLVIWGPPEDANSWEVTEGFIADWGWLVKGSLMLQYSTNKWRAVRGESAIYFA